MITRAQAEALLTLAESLEACERQGIEVQEDSDGVTLVIAGKCHYPQQYSRLTGATLRLAVNHLVPKHTGS